MSLFKKGKERTKTDLSTGPQEPQSSFKPGGQIGKAPSNRGGGEMGEEGQRKPYSSKGESKKEKQTLESRPTGYRESSSPLPRRATFTKEAVHQASKGRKGQPLRPHPGTSQPARRGRGGRFHRTSTKAPSVLRRNSNNKGRETARTGPGAGRMKAGGSKGIKPVGAEARRSGKPEAQRRGGAVIPSAQ